MVPYNTALGGTLPGGALGGTTAVLQLKRTYELFVSSLDRTVEVVHAGRKVQVLDTASWDLGLGFNWQTRALELTNDTLAPCNLSDIHSAAWNASSRVARERCVGPDLLRGTWNATYVQVAKTIIALPGMLVAQTASGAGILVDALCSAFSHLQGFTGQTSSSNTRWGR